MELTHRVQKVSPTSLRKVRLMEIRRIRRSAPSHRMSFSTKMTMVRFMLLQKVIRP